MLYIVALIFIYIIAKAIETFTGWNFWLSIIPATITFFMAWFMIAGIVNFIIVAINDIKKIFKRGEK